MESYFDKQAKCLYNKAEEIINTYAMLKANKKGENFDINDYIKEYTLENHDKVKAMKKGLYVEFTGEIICRLDS